MGTNFIHEHHPPQPECRSMALFLRERGSSDWWTQYKSWISRWHRHSPTKNVSVARTDRRLSGARCSDEARVGAPRHLLQHIVWIYGLALAGWWRALGMNSFPCPTFEHRPLIPFSSIFSIRDTVHFGILNYSLIINHLSGLGPLHTRSLSSV